MSSRLKDKEINLINKVASNVLKYKLIENGDTVLIGLSGGPDSVFLTVMLVKMQEILEKENICYTLKAAHINHMIREEAEFDENIAKKLCKDFDIEFFIKKTNVLEIAKEQKIGTEECGRNVRYSFFKELCEKNKYSKIAVAHNMEDNAETVIMNFLRGAGSTGLKGIEYKSSNVIRPILNISKKDILEYLNANNMEYAIDKTNLENNYTRNKIRNVLIKQLEEYNPNIVESITNMSNILKAENNIVEEYANIKADSLVIKKEANKDTISLEEYRKLKEYEKNIIVKKVVETFLESKKEIAYSHIEEIVKLLNEAKTNKLFEIKNKYSIKIQNKQCAIIEKKTNIVKKD